MPKLKFEATMDRLKLLIQAGYPVIYIVSHEEARVLDCVARIVNRLRAVKAGKHLWRWSAGQGLQRVRNLPDPETVKGKEVWMDVPGLPNPVDYTALNAEQTAGAAIKDLVTSQNGAPRELQNSVIVFFDLHPDLLADSLGAAGPMVRPLRNAAESLRQHYDRNRGAGIYQSIIVVGPAADRLSIELSRDLITIDFPLPETEELYRILDRMTQTVKPAQEDGMSAAQYLRFPDPVPVAEIDAVCRGEASVTEYQRSLKEAIAGAGRGLTLAAYIQGLNMIRVEEKMLRPKHIDYMLQLKADTINSQALQYTPRVEIELGGLEVMKQWIAIRRGPATNRQVRVDYRLPPPKGIMLCGAAGGGKSQLAKLIAKEFNLALLRLDIGALFGSYVGESEQRAREALQLAEVLAPVVLWIDEIDKGFVSTGGGDNGVSARVFGHFLTWLAEKQADVFVVVTANDPDKILGAFPEFGRKGRFDEIFWVGLPKEDARREIFRIYLRRHFADKYLRVDDGEVAALCRAAEIPDVPVAEDTMGRFLAVLADDRVSGNMTGAEIEAAIGEALYRAYDADQRAADRPRDTFTGTLVGAVVKKSRDRALYMGDELAALNSRGEAAGRRGWLFI